MAERMTTFVTTPPAPPEKRAAAARAQDFAEIHEPFPIAGAQASRCAQCGVPFCQSGCPLQNHIPDWLRLAAEGRVQEAYALSASTNPMPEVCGRICPQDRLCEGACVIEQSGHGAVTIGAVERWLTDRAFLEGWVEPVAQGRPNGRSVGIIGAGPAGLAAAERLREYGAAVTVYDRQDRAGGLLWYGIPNFKLDKAIVARRIARLTAAGVAFVLNCEVGRDVALAELRARHDAVLIAAGVYAPRALHVAGGGRAAPALAYLNAATRAALGDAPIPAGLDARGRRVVVIGGGDTAMDCVRTAIRQGAQSVACLYRRDRANMPGSAREVVCAEEEGVQFRWLAEPAEIKPQGVWAARMALRPAERGARAVPERSGEEFLEPADLVIAALGFEAEPLPNLWGAPELACGPGGRLRIDPRTGMTSLEGVFAAGDIVRGASLVVWALRDGLEAAAGIQAYLEARARTAKSAAA